MNTNQNTDAGKMTLEEINKMVYDRYPVKKREIKCVDFKCKRDGVRNAYRKRLLNEYGAGNIKQIKSD